jgi:hypothetical protein
MLTIAVNAIVFMRSSMPGQADSYPFLREKTLRRKITALGIFAMPAGRGVGRVVLSALKFFDDHAADLLA